VYVLQASFFSPFSNEMKTTSTSFQLQRKKKKGADTAPLLISLTAAIVLARPSALHCALNGS